MKLKTFFKKADEKQKTKLFHITKIIAESDSIGEGWLYQPKYPRKLHEICLKMKTDQTLSKSELQYYKDYSGVGDPSDYVTTGFAIYKICSE